MTPKKTDGATETDLFRSELVNLLDQRHELCRLAELINWQQYETEFGQHYCDSNGSPGKPIRLMVGLEYLKQIHDVSDEVVVKRWVENPYWQYFCGEQYFQHELPIDPSSLSRFRRRIGEAGAEKLLAETIQAGVKSGAVKPRDFKRVTVDTTVQEKAVTYPTDSKLLNRSRERLVKLCRQHPIRLRQSYARKGPQAVLKAGRYAHARQMKRMQRMVKRLRTYLGRVVRDIERKLTQYPGLALFFAAELAMARRLLSQERHSKNKLYSLHAPEVECLSKGKVHKRYEFGVKVSITVTNRSNFIVGARALPGNPYDGHTLSASLAQTRQLTGSAIEEAFVDRGYRGHAEEETTVYISGQKRGITTRSLRQRLKRRQAIEPVIGHLKSDGRMDRNYLLGEEGDALNVLLCSAGHNLRLALRQIRKDIFWPWVWGLLVSWLPYRRQEMAEGISWVKDFAICQVTSTELTSPRTMMDIG